MLDVTPTRILSRVQGRSLRERAEADDVRFVLAMFTTLTGKPCAKLVPVGACDMLEQDGVGFAGFAAGALGQQPRDPDVVAVPDLSSYAPLPFVKPGLAMVHCDPHVEGSPHPFAPRVILRKAIEQAAAAGFEVKTGAEVEYFLVDRDATGALRVADPRDAAAQPCYDARGLTRMYDHLTAVTDAMDALGWEPYASDHEDGNGQFEQNFAYSDVLTTADRVVTLRYLVHMLAEQRGMTATFMPKPFTDRTGSGMHLHLSLWRDDEAAFPDAAQDSHGLGISRCALDFVGGILEHAPAMHALMAPTVNSYKRIAASTTTSGATWAPSQVASYGGNDRTHLVRIPDDLRIELRGADGSADPYLASAAVVAAGLDGIAQHRDPGLPGERPAGAVTLPRTLLDAVQALDADPVLRAALDAADPSAGVADYYSQLKREEFYAWHDQVSQWEIDRYLTSV